MLPNLREYLGPSSGCVSSVLLERETGFEPPTLRLGTILACALCCERESATEIRPVIGAPSAPWYGQPTIGAIGPSRRNRVSVLALFPVALP
jgi:hypothetical protein